MHTGIWAEMVRGRHGQIWIDRARPRQAGEHMDGYGIYTYIYVCMYIHTYIYIYIYIYVHLLLVCM